MKPMLSVAVAVYNQRRELKAFLRALKEAGFMDEAVVVVIGGEDPLDLLERPWGFAVKALYLEKRPSQQSLELARAAAALACDGVLVFHLDVRQAPTKGLLKRLAAKEAQKLVKTRP